MKSLMLSAGMSFALIASGATNYVDCALQDYTNHDGSSWELAYETIQEMVVLLLQTIDNLVGAVGILLVEIV